MNGFRLVFAIVVSFVVSLPLLAGEPQERFDPAMDLFLPQFDSKTDVDDVHSIAAVATILASPEFSAVRYHAVAGAYGRQEGLYVPSNELFTAAFGDDWSDAHNHRDQALAEVTRLVTQVLSDGGSVWVAEAGQSDFTADWLERIQAAGLPTDKVNVVQHSDWNEESATPEKLNRVKTGASYHKIGDGNVVGNGTPGFITSSEEFWPVALASPSAAFWQHAKDIGNRYNGADGRYLNEFIQSGGMDFSDTAETCWILGCDDLRDVAAFFSAFGPH